LLALYQTSGERSQTEHHHQVYSNVFFNTQPQTGRPSTSFVMVKSDDGRSYQLSNSGVDFIFSNDPRQDRAARQEYELSSNSVSLTLSQCPEVDPKPSQMCVNKTSSCWSQGQPDVDCPDFGLCCYDGCVASCLRSPPPPQETGARLGGSSQCPPVEDKLAGECSNATANCWSRGVADVDCPDFGLCCYDGCVNTCLINTDQDIQYDLSLAEGLEEEEEEEEDLAEELDDQLDDSLGDELDGYGAPQAAPITYLADIDTYGSPLAEPVTAYKDIVENDLRTQPVGIGSKKEHSSPIVTRNAIAGVGPFFFQSGQFSNLGKRVKPKKNKISQVKKSGRNPYKTKTAFSSFKYANGIDNNNKVKQYQSHKTEKSTKFRSSKQFQPIFFRGGQPGVATIKRTESPVKNIVRKKLQLTEKPRGPNVMSTLEKILKKHFSIFSYF